MLKNYPKKAPWLRLVSSNENSSIISGPNAAPSNVAAKYSTCRAIPSPTVLTAHAPPIGDSDLVDLIGDIQDDFPGYGYRRVTLELARHGVVFNHKRVCRAIRALDLGVKPRRRFVRTTDSDQDLPIFPNLYRNVIATRPNVVRGGDITSIRLVPGFCDLAALLDACSRKVSVEIQNSPLVGTEISPPRDDGGGKCK